MYRTANYQSVLEIIDQIDTAFACDQAALLMSLFSKLPEHFQGHSLGMEEVLFFIANLKPLFIRYRADQAMVSALNELEDPEALLLHFSDFTGLCSHFLEFFHIGKLEQDKPSSVNESFVALLQEVNQNLHVKLQLGELAAKYHLNYTYCCDLFKSTTGKTFVQYVTEQRLQKAEKLLTQTDLPLDLIADKVGFNDTHYFSNVFKRAYHMPPSKYRKQAKA
jgi:two-component system response regulator YesN